MTPRMHLYRVVVLLGVVGLIGGCAPADPVPTPEATAAAQRTTVPTIAPTATLQPSPTSTPLPQLTIWIGESGEDYALIAPILQRAAQQIPLDLRIERRDADGLRAGLALAEQLGEALPQLLWTDQHTVAALGAEGRLTSWPADFRAGTLRGLQQWSSGDIAVPLSGQQLLLLYRLPDQPRPASVRELTDAALAAILPARAGMVQGWGAIAWFYPWYRALGGQLVGADDQPTLDNEALRETVLLLRAMYGAAPRNGDTLDRGRRLLANGQTAYSIDSAAAWPTLQTLSETLEVELTPLPPLSDGTVAPTLIGGSFLAALQGLDDEQQEAAQQLAQLLQSEETQRELSGLLQRLPARAALFAAPEVQNDVLLRAMAEAAPVAEGLAATSGVRCSIFAVEVYLYTAITADRLPADLAETMQAEADYCMRRSDKGNVP